MPFVNVIRGETIADAPITLRTPSFRVPVKFMLAWWAVKTTGKLAWLALRFWYVTAPVLVLLALYSEYGWVRPLTLAGSLIAVGVAWWFAHRSSFLRFAAYPAVSRLRRAQYARRWYPAMSTAGLTVRFDHHTVVPVLRKVRCRPGTDELLVRIVTGQIPDDFAKVSERLAHTFGVRAAKVLHGTRPDLIVIVLMRGDPLTRIVGPLPVPAVPDFTALPVALQEDGQLYGLRLFGTQVLIVGATGAGKGSVIWSLLRALAGGIASGQVRVWAFDPKGGMELAAGMPLFARFACEDFEAMADALEELVEVMRERTSRLRGRTRQHIPTVDDPLYVLIIDELAALTAYIADRKLKDRIKAALGILLTQGRAVGVHIVAALQDPRKEVLPFRDLFPTRIGLRLAEEGQVDMVLGDGMRDRGALCDRIPQSAPGTAFVVLEGDPTPMRVRFSYLTDDDITDLCRTYGRLRVIDGEIIDGLDGGAA